MISCWDLQADSRQICNVYETRQQSTISTMLAQISTYCIVYVYIYTSIPPQTRKGTIFRKRYDSWSWPNYFWSGPEILVGPSGNVPFSKNHIFSGFGGDICHECMHGYGSDGNSLLAARFCSLFGSPLHCTNFRS